MTFSRLIRKTALFIKQEVCLSNSFFTFSKMSRKQVFEASERNKAPILEVLQKVVPEKFGGISPINVLEIGSGTGQHAVYFSENMPDLIWHPSDINAKYIDSINAYLEESHISNLRQPVHLNVSDLKSNNFSNLDHEYHMIVCINLIHIAPWKCSEGLFKAAGKLLAPGGILVTYGPYSVHSEITPESNVRFDESLKAQNPEWGLRDIDDMETLARENSMTFDAMFDMPANNKTLVWLKHK